MPPTPAPGQPPAVDKPAHPLYALTTYELRDYARQLSSAIAFFDKQAPVPPIRAGLQAALDDVLAEQDDRAEMAARA